MFLNKNLFAAFLFLIATAFSQDKSKEIVLGNAEQGFIPVWLVTGPVEFPLVGFGQAKDTVAIGEPGISSPCEGEYAFSILPEKDKTLWFIQSADNKGFVDFKSTLGWNVDVKVPVKIWYARAGYAFTTIISDHEREALLALGSNSQTVVFFNGERVHTVSSSRNAVRDQDTIRIKLKKGANDLLIRVLNTDKNLGISFFGTLKWEWGFFSRLLDKNGAPLTDVKYVIKTAERKSSFDLTSTIYFRKIDNQLKQRIDVEINSFSPEPRTGKLKLSYDGRNYEFRIDSVRFGATRHSVYVPELTKNTALKAELSFAGELITKNTELQKRKKYDLHIMLLNHTDIGYTHPQPVCEEAHCNTLDEVLKMCKDYPDFHWTIETTWQLEAYEKLRTKEKFIELIALIKEGRIAVSPVYANPFNGYISEEEMLRSFEKAVEYKNRYGLTYSGAVYNDVPGLAWFFPQVLSKAGVKFIAQGINEFFSDYKLQRSLPKVFKWEAADGSRVLTYLNEAYNEGKAYGLESNDLYAVEQSIFERISKLEARNYQPDAVLINTCFTDNGPLAANQYHLAMKWNKEYEYPKFISSDVNRFTETVINSKSYNDIPVLRGDWTSNWDIFGQGEFRRHKDARWIQHQMLTAEKMSTISSLIDKSKEPMNTDITQSYQSLLQFSGHGSGLEYGYGSPEANKLTMDFRQQYVDNARLGTETVLLRSMYQLSKPQESLESEGVYIFNSLSWKRSDLAEIQYPFDNSPQYDVFDAGTNSLIPSFRKGHKQFFVAADVPSVGFKKYLLRPESGKTDDKCGLAKTVNSIENKYYKITFDENRLSVLSVVDKKSGKELLNSKSSFTLAGPTLEKAMLNRTHATITGVKTAYEIIDESPVRLIIRVTREGNVFETVDYSLIDGIDKVFIGSTVNLAALKTASVMEEYGLPFSFDLKGAKVKSEILGGFIDQDKDRLPGVDHDGVSLRRAVSIFNDSENIVWSTAGARVIKLRKDQSTDEPVIISNPVNNFPENWNRHEETTGRLEFNYSFSSSTGGFDPAKTTMQGYELNTPLQLRKSWYSPAPASEEYINIDNKNIILVNLKAVGEGTAMRLINADADNVQAAKISSKLFRGFKAGTIDVFGNKTGSLNTTEDMIKVTLKPGEFTDILIK